MKVLRPISVLVCLALPATSALAQLLPPPGMPAPKASKPAAKPAKAKLIKPAAKKPAATPAAAGPQAPAAAPDDPNADVVFGAYQRGQYKTAFDLATARVANGDPKAMAMLG